MDDAFDQVDELKEIPEGFHEEIEGDVLETEDGTEVDGAPTEDREVDPEEEDLLKYMTDPYEEGIY